MLLPNAQVSNLQYLSTTQYYCQIQIPWWANLAVGTWPNIHLAGTPGSVVSSASVYSGQINFYVPLNSDYIDGAQSMVLAISNPVCK